MTVCACLFCVCVNSKASKALADALSQVYLRRDKSVLAGGTALDVLTRMYPCVCLSFNSCVCSATIKG